MSTLTSANRIWDDPTARMRRVDVPAAADRGDRRPEPSEPGGPAPRRVIDAGRLWSGGVATAVVAALTALTGTLLVRAVLAVVPGLHATAFAEPAIVLLCTLSAVAALAATGVAHLLLLSTPRPLEFLGWIIGLGTAVAVIVPFVAAGSLGDAAVLALLHLVIGLAIATLTGSAASAARRIAARATL